MILTFVALLLDGATGLFRGGQALLAGRTHTAMRAVVSIFTPALPVFALWLVTALLFFLFTLRAPRRANVDLAARASLSFVLGSVLVGPIANQLSDGLLPLFLRALPWLWAAVVFGALLLEALEPAADEGALLTALPPRARALGSTLAVLIVLTGIVHMHQAWGAAEADPRITALRGKAAPPIDLPLVGGGELHLAQLSGKRVVLTFWATWCMPCLAELPALDRAYRRRGPEAALVYAINVDEAGPEREALVKATIARLQLTLPVALDDGKAGQAYSIATIPTVLRINADGKLGEVYDGPVDEAGLNNLLK